MKKCPLGSKKRTQIGDISYGVISAYLEVLEQGEKLQLEYAKKKIKENEIVYSNSAARQRSIS